MRSDLAGPSDTDHESRPSARVAVLGLGPMGRAVARTFAASGCPTTVWNRTAGRLAAVDLVDIVEAPSVEAAVASCDLVVTCLLDHSVVRSVLDRVTSEWDDRVLVNLTMTSPGEARDLARWASGHGIRSLDGAILSPATTVGTPAFTVLLCGPVPVHQSVASTLSSLGGTQVFVGDDHGRASAFDMALLDMFVLAVHGIVHGFAVADAEQISPEQLAAFAQGLGPMLPALALRFAKQLRSRGFRESTSTITSHLHVVEHVIDTARSHGIASGALDEVADLLRVAEQNGAGDDGLARLTTLLTS